MSVCTSASQSTNDYFSLSLSHSLGRFKLPFCIEMSFLFSHFWPFQYSPFETCPFPHSMLLHCCLSFTFHLVLPTYIPTHNYTSLSLSLSLSLSHSLYFSKFCSFHGLEGRPCDHPFSFLRRRRECIPHDLAESEMRERKIETKYLQSENGWWMELCSLFVLLPVAVVRPFGSIRGEHPYKCLATFHHFGTNHFLLRKNAI